MGEMKAGVLTVSDRVSRGEAEDVSGPTAIAILAGLGFEVDWQVVPDDKADIQAAIRTWIDAGFELVVTTGGTGFARRDVTPEATSALIDRPAPGLIEAARMASAAKNPNAMNATNTSEVRLEGDDTLWVTTGTYTQKWVRAEEGP